VVGWDEVKGVGSAGEVAKDRKTIQESNGFIPRRFFEIWRLREVSVDGMKPSRAGQIAEQMGEEFGSSQ
jgi:hypothetical protein